MGIYYLMQMVVVAMNIVVTWMAWARPGHSPGRNCSIYRMPKIGVDFVGCPL